ncbi:hypothetical protein DEI99_015960 [Curtobacterium sp. MCLR17_036]|uniref:hypothetical protein n=1 Tax=Curtobacterium sp. MCLR17_036 TaxID=2175620 RepID=UPI0011B4AB28|nr:hypothetical protein [Curtobacterium sp. MCLR17_036]WIE64707.1 hypothetical protein DEI99_015960 [Curtobacterium sp. MCLR17_036]
MTTFHISAGRSHRPLAIAAVLVVLLAVIGFATPARAAVTVPILTARVASIVHNDGTVTLAGTGDPGDRVTVQPSDGAAVDARVRTDGSWRAVTHVDDFGDHTFTVSDSIGSPQRTVRATTKPVTWLAMLITREGWNRSLKVSSPGGFEPGARLEFSVDGAPSGSTVVDRDGKVAHRITGVGFGKHTLTTVLRFDGAEQLRVNATADQNADPRIDDVVVDAVGHTVHVSGRGPAATQMRFVDESGAPWSLVDGDTDWIENTDGTWEADLAYPADGTRFMGIIAEVHEDGKLVGSATSGAMIPFPTTATVDRYAPRKLVLSGSAEPNARLSFTDADGAPATDADGNAVEPRVPGLGGWTVTLDPRRLAGGTVTVHATGDDGPLGSATVTYR